MSSGAGDGVESPALASSQKSPLLFLRKTEKLHAWTAQLCHGIRMLRLPFKLFRRTIAQRRMQSLLIVVPVDKFLDAGAQVIEIAILVGVDFFRFKAFKKL